MEQLVTIVAEKVGITEDQARTAVETVLGFLKTRLPAPVAQQIDGLLAGDSSADVSGLAAGLGGMFGKK
jgi:uncharacterized protein (DUF2267 family)